MIASYLALIEIGKRWFYRTEPPVPAIRERTPYHRLLRRAARFTTASPSHLPRPAPRQRTHNSSLRIETNAGRAATRADGQAALFPLLCRAAGGSAYRGHLTTRT